MSAAQDQPIEENMDKGKGKQTEQDPMEEDESSSEEENDEQQPQVEEPDDDNMEEIDADNIMGSRTRGKAIDYAQAAKDLPADDDDDEDDDDDFVDDEDKMKD